MADAPETASEDPRFTIGLLIDVRTVLVKHGYPDLDVPGLVELRQHLFHLLHGQDIGDGKCSGKTFAARPPRHTWTPTPACWEAEAPSTVVCNLCKVPIPAEDMAEHERDCDPYDDLDLGADDG